MLGPALWPKGLLFCCSVLCSKKADINSVLVTSRSSYFTLKLATCLTIPPFPIIKTGNSQHINAMPEEQVEAGSVTTFKRLLDRYLNGQGIEKDGIDAGVGLVQTDFDSQHRTGRQKGLLICCTTPYTRAPIEHL